MIHSITSIGGVFAILIVVHLLADQLGQTETMARRRADEPIWMLIVHSATYSAIFIPFLILTFHGSVHLIMSSVLALMMSHGAIDTYAPIWLWARFVRRPGEMREDPIKGFAVWCLKPHGVLLTFTIDQLMHACFLIPVAFMAVLSEANPAMARSVGTMLFFASIGLAAMSVATILLLWKKPSKSEDILPNDDDNDRPSMPSQHDE